ncbi:MAG: RnfABCDGE type electron transport complex subunit D [Blautia massiliensis (ex Durand et al. 2017)]
MPNPIKIDRSENYEYYKDLLLCAIPLTGMAWYYYGARPVILMMVALFTAYLCDCALAPLHGPGYHSHEPSSECFAALITLMMPATVPYAVVVAAVIAAVLAKEAFGGEGHYPFHPAAVGMVVAGISWPGSVYQYPTPGTVLPLYGVQDAALSPGMNAVLQAGGLPSDSTMNLLTGNVTGGLGTSAALVVIACGLFLLVRGHAKPAVLIPFFVLSIGLPWLLPQLNELPAFSWPWEFVRQRVYLEKYVILSGTMLFGGLFMICEPVTMPNRISSRILYGAALGVATFAFRLASPYESPVCFALLIVGAIPEWLDLISHRTERIRFMRKEARRLAQSAKQE